jgi:branched-chain amino acid transport system ATP-binding protein
MVEHNMKVIAELCDRVTVLQSGEVLAEGTYDEVSRNPLVMDAYMGGGHA